MFKRTLLASVLFPTVVPGGHGVFGDLDVAAREPLSDGRVLALVGIAYTRLEVVGSALTPLSLRSRVDCVGLKPLEEFLKGLGGVVLRQHVVF